MLADISVGGFQPVPVSGGPFLGGASEIPWIFLLIRVVVDIRLIAERASLLKRIRKGDNWVDWFTAVLRAYRAVGRTVSQSS